MTAIKLPAYSTLSKMSKAALITLGDKIAVAMDTDFTGVATMSTRDLVSAVTILHEEYLELLAGNSYDEALDREADENDFDSDLISDDELADIEAEEVVIDDDDELADVEVFEAKMAEYVASINTPKTEAEDRVPNDDEVSLEVLSRRNAGRVDVLLVKMSERYLGGSAETSNQRKALRAALRKLGYRVSDHKKVGFTISVDAKPGSSLTDR